MKTDKRLDIQGLRAIAVLSVVGYHGGLRIPGGFSGVDIFFVVSGYVITSIINREIGLTGNFSYLRFYIRRSKRLLPALSVVVSFVLLLSVFFMSPFGDQQNTSKTAIGSVFSLANVVIAVTTGGYFDLPAEMNPLLHTWSLSVEEQFYLVFPFLLATTTIFSKRKGLKVGWSIFLFVSIFLISLISALIVSNFELSPKFETVLGFYSPISRAWEFIAGALIAFLHHGFANRISDRTHELFSVFGLTLLGLSFTLISESTPWPGFWTLLPVAGTCMLLFSANFGNSIPRRVLESKASVFVGDLSYSIYLWHWPVIVFASLAFPEKETAFYGALLSFIPATASYYLIENKFRRSDITSVKKTGLTLLVFAAIPSLLGLVVLAGANKGWGIQWSNTATLGSQVALANCTDKAFDPEKCTWGPSISEKRILLVGDSQAYFWADGVIPAAKELGYQVTVSSISGCPFGVRNATGTHVVQCEKWQVEILNWALDNKPDLVIIANRSSGYTMPEIPWRTLLDSNGQPANSQNIKSIYFDSLSGVIVPLKNKEIPILLMQNIPSPPNPIPFNPGSGKTIYSRFFNSDSSDKTFDVQESLVFSNRSRSIENEIESTYDVSLYDPLAHLCDLSNGQCESFVGNVPIYLDFGHLTFQGAASLQFSIAEAIKDAGSRK